MKPDGLRWRLTAPLTRRSRRARFDLFMDVMKPRPTETVLDVGVTDTDWRDGNFFESRYQWPGQITAVAPRPMPAFSRGHSDVTFVIGDGRQLPFPDSSFDIGFSNAVIEHVGSREDQRRFIAEMTRVCRRVFVCTPNAAFPVDPHTLLPFVHWLPRKPRDRALRLLGNGHWAGQDTLNPLTARQLLELFPARAGARLISQRMFFLTSVLIAVTGAEAA